MNLCYIYVAGQVSDTSGSVAQTSERGSSIGSGFGTTLGLLGPTTCESAPAAADRRSAEIYPCPRVSVQLLWETVRNVVELEDAFKSAYG